MLSRIGTGAKQAFRRLQTAVLVIATIWSPVAFAVEIEVSRTLQFQMINDENRESTGLLKAGSRLEIPERFQIKTAQGAVDHELTLNNWLKTAGRTGYAETNRGGGLVAKTQDSLDYYYPIKVVAAAPGSTLPKYKGHVYFLALRMMTRQGEALRTREDSRPRLADAEAASEIKPRGAMEAMGTCPGGVCSPRSQSSQFDQLVSVLGPALRRAQVRADLTKRRTTVDMRELAASFQRSCGFPLKSFLPIVKKETSAAGVPEEIMLAMMVQESSGRCYSASHNDNGTRDSGLFGVNSGTAHMRRCTSAEISWLRSAQPSRLESGPRCIENPVLNLQAALKILKGKIDALTPPFVESRLKDANGKLTPDAWRMAVSAYNGGERWVMTAKKDLDSFNEIHGTKLSAYNWEDLRVFYLRAYLSDHQQERFIGRVRDGRQATAILNLAYAENLVPRSNAGEGSVLSAGEIWRRKLARND